MGATAGNVPLSDYLGRVCQISVDRFSSIDKSAASCHDWGAAPSNLPLSNVQISDTSDIVGSRDYTRCPARTTAIVCFGLSRYSSPFQSTVTCLADPLLILCTDSFGHNKFTGCFIVVRKHMVNCRLCAWTESTWPTVGVVHRRGQHKTQYFWLSWLVSSINVEPVFLPHLTVWSCLQFAQMPTTRDLAIFVLTTADGQTDCLPLARMRAGQ